jgi:uncharacterized membrane protein YfcA
MNADHILLLCIAIGGLAFLYSSVGHAGASGYIAVLSLTELPPSTIKPTALMLNIIVATIATWQFARRGHFSWPLFWPFALLAVPMAFLGGYLNLPVTAFRVIVGVVLILSAVRFIVGQSADTASAPPAIAVAVPLAIVAVATGFAGAHFGSHQFPHTTIHLGHHVALLEPQVVLIGWWYQRVLRLRVPLWFWFMGCSTAQRCSTDSGVSWGNDGPIC